jgi:hypothetical protein
MADTAFAQEFFSPNHAAADIHVICQSGDMEYQMKTLVTYAFIQKFIRQFEQLRNAI